MRHWLPLFLSREASAAPIFMSSKKLILLLVFLLLTISVSAKTEFYSNQEECEHKTGHICAFQMCDYVPEGKTFDEVCGRDFKKGWVPIGVPKLIVDPEDRICKIDTDCIVIPTSCNSCSYCESANKNHQGKYQKKFTDLCQYYQAFCVDYCPRSWAECINQQCTLTEPNQDQK